MAIQIDKFNRHIATDVGVNSAIIYNCINMFIKSDDAFIFDNMRWSKITLRRLDVIFTYLSKKQISLALEKLESAGYIKSAFLHRKQGSNNKSYTILKEAE